MSVRAALIAGIAGLAGAAWAQPAATESAERYDGHRVVRVRVASPDDYARMLQFSDDPWVCEAPHAGEHGTEVDFRVDPAQFDRLSRSGIGFRVVVEDVQALVDAEAARIRAAASPDAGADGDVYFDDFRDYATTSAYVNALVAINPAIASRFSAGTSIEGRDIFGVRISGAAPGAKPGFHIQAIQHAREWAVLPVAMWAADRLIRLYGVDPQITALVDSVEFTIIPIFNPDGYVHSWTTSRLWRKNRRNNGDGSFGVDLNRNWGFQWGGTGSSGTPSSETYRGPAPFSEPETLNVSNFISSRPNIRGLIDFHSNGQTLLFPWGFANFPCPDHQELNAIGTAMAAQMQAVNGIFHNPGPSGIVLYLSAGNVRDWAYGVRGIYPTTVEVRQGTSGFTPPASTIAPTNAENWAAVRWFGDWIASTNPVRFKPAAGPITSSPPATPTTVSVIPGALRGASTLDPASVRLWARTAASGPFTPVPMTDAGNGVFTASAPGAGCVPGDVDYYIEASTTAGETATLGSAASPLSYPVGARTTVFADNFDTNQGWTVGAAGDTATAGLWTRVDPVTNGAAPEDDNPFGTGTLCFVTQQTTSTTVLTNDVDNGPTSLTSPVVDGSGAGTLYLSYFRWFSNDLGANRNQPTDNLTVLLSNDNGATWTTVETVTENTGRWIGRVWKVSDVVAPTSQMRVRFTARDSSPDSAVEAGVDDVAFYRLACDTVPGDVNGDGRVDFADLNLVLSNFGQSGAGLPGDANGDGRVDFADLNLVLSNFGAGV